jgi:small multidrug resistance pump
VEGFSQFWPSVLVVIGYGVAFYCLALTLRVIPMGLVYAIGSGVGIGLITMGVVVMNVFSKTMRH